MALFGSKNKTETKTNVVRPTVVRTQNVAKEIFAIAKSYNIKPELLDFNILDIQTYTSMNDGTKEMDWEEISTSELYELDDETALLNPFFHIRQTYEIEIFSKSKNQENELSNFHVVVGANATKCKVYMSIKEGSSFSYYRRVEHDLRTLIDKKKVRAGILVNIFDEMVDEVTSRLSATARVEEKIEYKQKETLLIAESFEPTETRHDALILHYENQQEIDENTKIDYASRGFIRGVKKDELLIEYIKPKLGKPGRNCRGEYMQPAEPIINHEPTFKVDDATIKTVDTNESIQYIARENGYIALESDTYIIKSNVDVGEISFKTTGSISSGLDSDVNINVKEVDAVKDAIGSGMLVEVSEIEVEGNVGSNAKVIALKAIVGGQTHATALIKADTIDINVHKGKAVGKSVRVTRLEHGEIIAENADIGQALGGHIKAKEIDIEICASHVKATAVNSIIIKKLQGSENTFTIDPLINQEAKKGLIKNQEMLNSLQEDMKELSKEIKKYTIIIKEGSAAFLDIKKRLLHYKKNGVKMPESFVKKYKQFVEVQERLDRLKKEYDLKKDQYELHTTKTSAFQHDIMDSRIINRDRWVGYNEIRFKLVDPPIELVYKPKENSTERIFGLVEVEEGEYEIRALSEKNEDDSDDEEESE